MSGPLDGIRILEIGDRAEAGNDGPQQPQARRPQSLVVSHDHDVVKKAIDRGLQGHHLAQGVVV